MKLFRFLPLLFLTACSTAPKLALRPQPPSPALDNSTVRYPEVLHSYHLGRYVDPGDDMVMHEQHTVFRVEENTHWNLHPGIPGPGPASPSPTNAALPQRHIGAQPIGQQRPIHPVAARVEYGLEKASADKLVAPGHYAVRFDLEHQPRLAV